jgi:protein-tyrosine-phosphatase
VICFICTGNRARSPFAAALLRRHLKGLPVTVESRGAQASRGALALPGAVDAACSFAVAGELARHRSRPLARGELIGVDLAIGFEPYHVAAAVVDAHAPSGRTFLLTELADALDDTAPVASTHADLASLLALADARRASAESLPRAIQDPLGGSDARFVAIFREIDGLVSRVALRLARAIADPGL